jgi:hypothetical protein
MGGRIPPQIMGPPLKISTTAGYVSLIEHIRPFLLFQMIKFSEVMTFL